MRPNRGMPRLFQHVEFPGQELPHRRLVAFLLPHFLFQKISEYPRHAGVVFGRPDSAH